MIFKQLGACINYYKSPLFSNILQSKYKLMKENILQLLNVGSIQQPLPGMGLFTGLWSSRLSEAERFGQFRFYFVLNKRYYGIATWEWFELTT